MISMLFKISQWELQCTVNLRTCYGSATERGWQWKKKTDIFKKQWQGYCNILRMSAPHLTIGCVLGEG